MIRVNDICLTVRFIMPQNFKMIRAAMRAGEIDVDRYCAELLELLRIINPAAYWL